MAFAGTSQRNTWHLSIQLSLSPATKAKSLSLFQKHVGAQDKISPASQTLPYLSLLSWAHPPQPGLNQAGKAMLGPHQRICVQGFSISGDHSLQGGKVMQLSLGGTQSPHRPLELPTPQTRM